LSFHVLPVPAGHRLSLTTLFRSVLPEVMSLPCLRLNVEKLCTIQHALILSLHHLSPLWSGFLQVHLSDHPSIRLWCGSDKLSIGQRNSNRLLWEFLSLF